MSEADYVRPFGFRIADMMTDLLTPNFDYEPEATAWQAALDDLAAASPNGEITHVQLRIWWSLLIDEYGNAGDNFITPKLGSNDGNGNEWGTQWSIMRRKMTDNGNPIPADPEHPIWQRWYFGQGVPLAYGPCAVERIREKGFKVELALSGAWGEGPSPPAKPGGTTCNIGGWGAREADYPNWIAAGGGDQFLENYKNNVLLPVANFAKDYLQNGDIFSLSFEMSYPTSDFTWSHNAKWNEIINAVRNVFRAAGKSIVLTLDHCGPYDDYGLGYQAIVKADQLGLTSPPNASARLGSGNQGLAGANYLANLDFVSISWWLEVVSPSAIPSTWSLANDVGWVTDAWFGEGSRVPSASILPKLGTGYGGVAAQAGRDQIQDLRLLSAVFGKLVLMNTGWANGHGVLASHSHETGTLDNTEQAVAWAAQLAAIGDARSQMSTWCAGQDFERYCYDKGTNPSHIDTSWRKAPAQAAIIDGIRSILSQ